jgi:hypothetical protein
MSELAGKRIMRIERDGESAAMLWFDDGTVARFDAFLGELRVDVYAPAAAVEAE